jgi:PAS domain S-box-containing protein
VLLQLTLLDITERSQAIRALRESKAKFRFLTESMKDVVWTADVKTLRFLYVSPSVKRLRGYTPEEIMAEPMDAALTPEAAVMVRQLMSNYLWRYEAGEIKDLAATSITEELPQPCKDGSIVWTEVVTGFRRNPLT